MNITDTHCHLIDEAFTSDVEACVVRAQEAGVNKIVLACCDETEYPQILDLCRQYPETLFPSIGIHPENMAADIDQQLQSIESLLTQTLSDPSQPKLRAIGEIGIDLHWDTTRLDDQLTILERQLDWALQYDLPVLLHIRDAMPQFLAFLQGFCSRNPHILNNNKRLRGILHCYSGTADEALEAMRMADLLIGVGGTLTYKKSKVPEVVKAIGLEHLVLETDAPYLAPVPHRGQRNEPAFTADTCRFLAQLLETTTAEVANTTSRNAEMLFGF